MTKPDPSSIWNIADLLLGPYRPKEYGAVIPPFTMLTRLDAVLRPAKDEVLKVAVTTEGGPNLTSRAQLKHASGRDFYNVSSFTLHSLGDPSQLAVNLQALVEGFDPEVFEVFAQRFEMPKMIRDPDDRDRLPEAVNRFAALNVRPDQVSNADMGDVFEELIRRFKQASKDVAGDHFTPREVVRITASVIFAPDEHAVSDPHLIR